MALAIIPAFAFILLLIPQPLRFASETWPSFYEDDFYYYVVIAQHLVQSGLSSFDGTTLTNGYHPLWMAVLAGLLGLSGGANRGFFLLLVAVQITAYAAAIWQVARLLARENAPAPIIVGATLLFAVSFTVCAITGMEVIIAVPLIIAFIAEAQRAEAPGGLRAFRFGLLASAVILARVDAAILVFLICAAVLPALRSLASRPRDLLRLGLGLVPSGIYFGSNLVVFGTMLPLSSAAKSLAPRFFFNTVPLNEVFLNFSEPVVASVMTIPAWCILACSVAGLLTWRKSSPSARLRTATCAFPPLFYMLLAVRSDWLIWEWYLYPIAVAVPLASLTMGKALYRWNARFAEPITVAAGLLFAVIPATLQAAGHFVNFRPGVNAMFTQAVALRPFITSHPGLYAMGDQAGTVTFLSHARMFQLEGLVEDKALLTDIANRKPLLAVLRSRHVDYYIGTGMDQDRGCWVGLEPKIYQAGAHSPEMAGRFCSAPVFAVKGTGNGHTLIFAVGEEK